MRWLKLLLLLSLFASCTSKNEFLETSFYYWKTEYKLSDYERRYLDGLNAKKIYFKAFDVLNKEPIGVLQWRQAVIDDFNYIPVVFIDNEVFRDIDSNENIKLVRNINRLLKGICLAQQFKPNEVQIDCDWTKGTKNNYFFFLTELKKQSMKTVSVTIRLHQIKFKESTGVPPCDYGVLMCYNMGNLKSVSSKNSIYDAQVLDAYLAKSSYERSLTAALPIFDWMLWYRDTRFIGILKRETNLEFIKKISRRYKTGFMIKNDTILGGHAFEKGDYIREETVSSSDLAQVKRYLSNSNLNLSDEIIYFSLDSINLSQYEKSTFTH